MSNMAGEMSGIVIVFSWKRYGDSVHIGYNVINILGVKLYIEVCNVLKSCSDIMHTEYDDEKRLHWQAEKGNRFVS